jgi:hypothetical protein
MCAMLPPHSGQTGMLSHLFLVCKLRLFFRHVLSPPNKTEIRVIFFSIFEELSTGHKKFQRRLNPVQGNT